MALLNMSFEHGQTWDVARERFELGITEAEAKFGQYIKSVEWGADRTSAKLKGSGFEVELRVDLENVHATGTIPFFAKFLEKPVRKFLEETFKRPALGEEGS